MTATPWRIAAQSYTVLDPETKEPILTFQFIVDHQQADMMKMRVTPTAPEARALELQFATGGFVTGEPVMQERWLKAFERPDPNLHLDDDAAFEEYANGLSEDQRNSLTAKREQFVSRRDEWQGVHGGTGSSKPVGGSDQPDDTDPNSPAAEAQRAKQSGADTTQPSDADRKGMVTQQGGGMVGEGMQDATSAPRAPNAPDQKLQAQGKPVDSVAGKRETAPAG